MRCNEKLSKNWKPSRTNYTSEKFQKIQQIVFDKNYFFNVNKNFKDKPKTACHNNLRSFTNNETKKQINLKRILLPWVTFAK